MRLEYTLTLDDLREATAPPGTGRQDARLSLALFVLLTAVGIVIAVGLLEPSDALRRFTHEPAPPEQNAWVTLAPSLVWLTLVVGATALHRHRTTRPPAIRPSAVGPALIGLTAVAWIALANLPWLALPWHPSPRRALWAAGLPCLVYLFYDTALHLTHGRYMAAVLWGTQQSIRRPGVLTLSDDAVVVTDPWVEQCTRWPHFASYRETAHLLLLVTADNTQIIIPYRALPDPADQQRLRALIQTHIPTGTFLPRRPAFPVGPAPAPG